jgi:hypothetical protein
MDSAFIRFPVRATLDPSDKEGGENVDRELLAHFLRAWPVDIAAPGESGDRAVPVMTHIVERLSAHPAVVFSRFGRVLAQTRPAIALFGDYTVLGGSSRDLVVRWFTDPAVRDHYLIEVGVVGRERLRRYRHAELGALELYRQVLVEPAEHQMLLVFTAVPGSPSDAKLRRLAAAGD